MENGCKVLKTTMYHQKNDPKTEVNLYLIRNKKIRHKGRSMI